MTVVITGSGSTSLGGEQPLFDLTLLNDTFSGIFQQSTTDLTFGFGPSFGFGGLELDNFHGSNFVYDGTGALISGTVTEFHRSVNVGFALRIIYSVDISGLNLDAATVWAAVQAHDGSISRLLFGGDTFFNLPNVGSTTIVAGDGNDVALLGAGNDTITLGNGNDQVFAGAGNDVVVVGNGNDYIIGGEGSNYIVLGNGNSIVVAGSLTATAQTDNWSVVRAGSGADTLLGGYGGNAYLIAGSGNDVLVDGTGTDVLVAGSGIDYLAAGTGTNYLEFPAQAIVANHVDVVDYFTAANNYIGLPASEQGHVSTYFDGINTFVYMPTGGGTYFYIDVLNATPAQVNSHIFYF